MPYIDASDGDQPDEASDLIDDALDETKRGLASEETMAKLLASLAVSTYEIRGAMMAMAQGIADLGAELRMLRSQTAEREQALGEMTRESAADPVEPEQTRCEKHDRWLPCRECDVVQLEDLSENQIAAITTVAKIGMRNFVTHDSDSFCHLVTGETEDGTVFWLKTHEMSYEWLPATPRMTEEHRGEVRRGRTIQGVQIL